jgi:sugar (pentulose or hexulose) kinase
VLGITLTTTPAELHRAFVDGIALAALDHAERIATAVTVGRWRVSGGGVRNASWLAATADALGVPLEVAPLAGEGAGPALFALAAMGVDPPPGRASLIEPDAAATSWYRDALAPYRARHPHLRGAP